MNSQTNDSLESDQTRIQAGPPQTQDFSNDSTNPTFGTLVLPGGVPEYPFLSAPQSADEIGRLGDYRILKKLGEGGMGFVFRGEEKALQRLVALKVMRPEVAAKPQAADRFLREGRAAAGLKSDHIITIYRADAVNGVPYLAMEFLEGLPLDEWIKGQKKAVPLPHAVRIVRDTLRGLAVAHEKGLIHRDIKPANLWIEKGTSRIKILDFGLTRSNDADMQLTQEGAVVGTPAFMAPEQASGKPVDPRADLFSVGVVMYTLLAGKNPFARGNLMETLGAVGFDTQPPIASVRSDVAKEYSDFLDRLLAKKPEDRLANAKAALQELVAIEKKSHDTTKTLSASAVGVPLVAAPRPQEAAPQVWGHLEEETTEASVRLPKASPAGPKKPSNKKLLLGGGLFAFLLLLGGIIIIITNKDGTKTKIEVPDGSKVEVKDKGKTVASVGGTKEPPTKVAMDADRKAAEWVESIGGKVLRYERPAGKPITHVELNNTKITDAGLKELAPFTNLAQIQLSDTQVTDAGLKELAQFKDLWAIHLNGTKVTDAGLKELAPLKNLEFFMLNDTQVTDAGLQELAQFKDLWALYLNGTQVTGTGLEALKVLKNLHHLHIYGTKVTADGVKKLKAALPNCKIESDFDATADPKPDVPRTFTNSVGMKFVPVSKGTAWLGGGGGKPGETKVEFKEDFYLGKYEVTQEEWEKVMGSNPSHFSRNGVGKDAVKDIPDADLKRFPVDQVSWDDCQLFIQKLNEKEKESGWVYRLPKEAEWEYACRGGPVDKSESAFDFYFAKPTNVLKADQANFDNVLMRTCRVGSYEPNLLGLHDMQGNVHEWCDDARTDGLGTPVRISRGGYWSAGSELCRVDNGNVANGPSFGRYNDLGLRLARVPNNATLKPVDSNRERKAAEWVASVGGKVTRDDKLPGRPVTSISLDNTKVTDAGLKELAPLKNLKNLTLVGTEVTDAGLKELTPFKSLGWISLNGTKVTDVGLKELALTKSIYALQLWDTGVTDAGLKEVALLTKLQYLDLNNTKVTDSGLKELAPLTDLRVLTLPGTKVTDAGLKELAPLTNLGHLNIASTRVTDAGMKELANFKNLKELIVNTTSLSDAGLKELQQLKSLTNLDVRSTKVTAKGLDEFRKALPKCKILHSGGTIEPRAAADPDRDAAEKLLPLFDLDILPAGTTQLRKVKAGSPMPAEAFVITAIRCWATDKLPRDYADAVLLPAIIPLTRLTTLEDSGSKLDMRNTDPAKWAKLAAKDSLKQFELSVPLSDAWIDTLRQFPNLAGVHVYNGQTVPVATLKRVAELKAVNTLRVKDLLGKDRWEAVTSLPLTGLSTSVTPDLDLAICKRIAAMPNLDTLYMYGAKLTADMLAALAAAPKLRAVAFTQCTLPATGLEHLARVPTLFTLTINVKEFTDAQLAQLAGAQSLSFLIVKDTAVTEAGVKALAAKIPACSIEWNGGKVKGK